MRREISDATTAHYIGEAVGAFAEEWHLEHPAGYNNGLCEGYAKLKQYRGRGAGLEGWTEVVESDKDRDVLLLVDMAIKAALEKLENKHGDSLNSDAVEKAEKDYAHGFEPDGDAFRWLVLQKAKDWLVEQAEEPAAGDGAATDQNNDFALSMRRHKGEGGLPMREIEAEFRRIAERETRNLCRGVKGVIEMLVAENEAVLREVYPNSKNLFSFIYDKCKGDDKIKKIAEEHSGSKKRRRERSGSD